MLIRHRVTAFDTIRALAARYLGAPSAWTEIAAANNLDGSDLSALVGQEIVIPISLQVDGGDQDPYKTDLAIVDGDLAWDGKDLKTVGGVDNYAASIMRAFNTEMGELPQHPDYGFNVGRYVGQAATSLYGLFLRVEAERVIRSDPRTRDVEGVEVTRSGTRRAIQIAASALDVLGKITKLTTRRES